MTKDLNITRQKKFKNCGKIYFLAVVIKVLNNFWICFFCPTIIQLVHTFKILLARHPTIHPAALIIRTVWMGEEKEERDHDCFILENISL